MIYNSVKTLKMERYIQKNKTRITLTELDNFSKVERESNIKITVNIKVTKYDKMKTY